MRFQSLLAALLAATANVASASNEGTASNRVATIFIQPVSSPPETPPTLLAELAVPKHNRRPGPSSSSSSQSSTIPAEVLSYEAPDFAEEQDSGPNSRLVRIGVYDAAAKRWTSPTSVMSVENFAKGYAPHFVLSVSAADGGEGEGPSYLGVVCRGVAIDAGHTRDFGPQAVVVRTAAGAQPVLGKPVVLSPEGRKVEEVGEKTFFQKYWWALALGAFILLSGGGDQK
ncbi:hypothetical protein VTK26DRAFT_322 [Humicola hyalothermophila]